MMKTKCLEIAKIETGISVLRCLSNYLGKHYHCAGCTNDVLCGKLKKEILGETK